MTASRCMVAAILAASAILVGGPLGGGPGSDVAAAGPPLTVVGDARYTVDPARSRADVAVDLAIRNRKADTVTRTYWYDRAYLAVQPTASGFRVSGTGTKASVRVRRTTKDYRLLEITFGRRLFSDQSMSLRLTFALRDRGGPADRFLRVGPALVSVPIWAYASDATPGARVALTLPPGFSLEAGGQAFAHQEVTDQGATVLRSGPIADAARFRSYVVAIGEAAWVEQSVQVPVGDGSIDVVVRGWDEDRAWRDRLSGLVARIVPVLAAETGLPGPARLVVEETSRWATDGGAVVLDPSLGRLAVASDASDAAILRGLSQAFLAADVLAERWAVEGFAPFFAEQAGRQLGIDAPAPAWSDDPAPPAGPLNAWSPGKAADPEADAAAAAAAVELTRRLVERVGEEAARAALARLAGGIAAYQPLSGSAATERVAGLADWRRIVDAFEAEAGESLDDLWLRFVTRPKEEALLARRRDARERYLATAAATGGWALPVAIREALTNWRFDAAVDLLEDVDRAFVERTVLARAASDLDLRLPDSVRPLVEAGRLDAASVEVRSEGSALEAIAAATALSIGLSPIAELGIVGATPAADLAAARSAFESGDLDRATERAAAASAVWADATPAGWRRAAAMALVAGAVLLGLLALPGGRRVRRLAAGPRTDPDEEPSR